MLLTSDNFLLYAAKYYDNVNCSSMEEFHDDLLKFKYLKKLFYNYKNKNILRERLILNHIVVLYNVFDSDACTKMLFFKLDEYKEYILPFIESLNYTPRTRIITGLHDNKYILKLDKIDQDEKIKEKLEKITRKKDG